MSAGAFIRVGVEGRRAPVYREVHRLGCPVLISAGSCWDNRRRAWKVPRGLAGLDVALDSGGFVAMKLHGGYRWSVAEYADLVGRLQPTWWAQMDFCCEPELAGNALEVSGRIDRTVAHLYWCEREARARGLPRPMPVLQGWRPSDYVQGPAFEVGFEWPELVGVGSVCRRPLRGSEGLLAVVAALDRAVPRGVRFHLFGVKSAGMVEADQMFPGRIASVDSLAWSVEAYRSAHKAGIPCSNEHRARCMVAWYDKQAGALAQAQEQGRLL